MLPHIDKSGRGRHCRYIGRRDGDRNAAEEQTLQEAKAFAHGTSEPFAIGAIGRQTLPVDDELVGGDIALVMIGDHDAPGVLRHQA